MAIPRRRSLTPNERVRERQVDDRVARARPRELDESWLAAARAWSRAHRRDVAGVLDMFDTIASTYFYAGDSWETAQARAWSDTVEVLCPRA
jgi:hypothetical protein